MRAYCSGQSARTLLGMPASTSCCSWPEHVGGLIDNSLWRSVKISTHTLPTGKSSLVHDDGGFRNRVEGGDMKEAHFTIVNLFISYTSHGEASINRRTSKFHRFSKDGLFLLSARLHTNQCSHGVGSNVGGGRLRRPRELFLSVVDRRHCVYYAAERESIECWSASNKSSCPHDAKPNTAFIIIIFKKNRLVSYIVFSTFKPW